MTHLVGVYARNLVMNFHPICPVQDCNRNAIGLPNWAIFKQNETTEWSKCSCAEYVLQGIYDEKGYLQNINYWKTRAFTCPHPDCTGTMRIPEKVGHRGKCMCHGCEIECKWENQKLTVELSGNSITGCRV